MSIVMGGQGPRSGVQLYKRRTYRPMSDINVTPFVDVMLVLLIVFMITAPLMTVGVPVDLPKSEAAPISEPEEPLVITLDLESRLFIQETEIDYASLVPRLNAITENRPDTRIYLRADRALPYGDVMAIMGRLSAAGFSKVALINEPLDAGDAQ